MADIPRTPQERQELEQRHSAFKAGQPVEKDGVRNFVLDSWLRCRAYFSPQTRPAPRTLHGRELEKRVRDNAFVIHNATPIMHSVFALLKGPDAGIKGINCSVFITDSDGVTLKMLSDGTMPLQEGFVFDERGIGTNSVYCCILNRYIATIYGFEHYFEDFAPYVASASPLITEDGSVHGAFGVLLHCEEYDLSIKAMSDVAAKAISSLMNAGIHKSQREFLLDHIDDAIIYTTEQHKILTFNHQSREFFPEIKEMDDLTAHVQFPDDFLQRLRANESLSNTYVTIKNSLRKSASFYATVNYDQFRGATLILRRARKVRELATQVAARGAVYRFDDILGESPALLQTKERARKAAGGDMTTLITGESGTGKELFAHAIHNAGSRADKPFLVVNCGALPQSLVQSELFGYEEGTFTGASLRGKAGKFELADGGTIFLDEIGELPLDVQANLLRFMQSGEISKIGAAQPQMVNVRVIAATNRDLQTLAAQGRFREDLFYRLNAFPIRIPPLRERQGDAVLLAEHFAHAFSVAAKGRPCPLSAASRENIAACAWPGNVRELEYCIQLHVNLMEGHIIDIPALPSKLPDQPDGVPVEGFETQKNSFERRLIVESLKACGGDVRQVSAHLNIPVSTLYSKIKKHGLRTQYRKAEAPDAVAQDRELGLLLSRLSPSAKQALGSFLRQMLAPGEG